MAMKVIVIHWSSSSRNGPYHESTDNKRARKAAVYIQEKDFNSFANDTIKHQSTKQNKLVC